LKSTRNKGLGIIIAIMVILTAAGIYIASVYYGNINRSVDPRVRQAQVMYGRYNLYAAGNDSEKVLALLDSIKNVYLSVAHYRNSYEMGVLENNRASVFLTQALSDTVIEARRQHYFSMAEQHLVQGIDLFTRWLDVFGQLTREEVAVIVSEDFYSDGSLENNEDLEPIIRNRVNAIMTAQVDTPRRLSVSFTNLGIIRRHENQIEQAYDYYSKALELWGENHAAKNNMNILFDRPVVNQSIIRKLFPPAKK
jgi:tetratricopeptide (TPR) repeat protein